MSYRILYPFMRWGRDTGIEENSVGENECIFVRSPDEVTDEQWRTCDAIVSAPDPSQYVDLGILEKCRIMVTPKVGFDNIDIAAWAGHGIPVSNVPDYGTQEVADHAMALLLALNKCIVWHNTRLIDDPAGNWAPAGQPRAKRLSASTIGIVGLGRIGTAMALRSRAFNARVVFYDPFVPNGSDLAIGVERLHSLEALFAASDIVSLHVPLSDATRAMINADILGHARPGLTLVNTARGEIIDLDALHDALRSGTLAAAGLDVLPEEPANPAHPLVKAYHERADWLDDRLVITPHSAFFTPESVHDMRFKGGEVAVRYLATGQLDNCVNGHLLG